LHVTLMFLGDFEGLSEPFLAAALRAAGTIRMRPFLAGFDRAMSFRARVPAGPLVLVGGDGVEGFRTLRSHMVEAMAGQGIRGFEASFTPHMTLSYDGQTIKEQFVDLLTWPVREFQLLRSVVGERRYIELGRWTLSGDNF
jgi:2'-5' RNA ligase